jgi:hypothetical protein
MMFVYQLLLIPNLAKLNYLFQGQNYLISCNLIKYIYIYIYIYI